MIYVGLDLSLKSTGICVYDDATKSSQYYIISPKFTKKAQTHNFANLTLITYQKFEYGKDTPYHTKELYKTLNTHHIATCIVNVLRPYHKICGVGIEGVSFGSNGSVVDLAGLNYAVRTELLMNQSILSHDNPELLIIQPTENKKFATGNGSAEKDLMISAWLKTNPELKGATCYVKCDDIADAYFLARYAEYQDKNTSLTQ